MAGDRLRRADRDPKKDILMPAFKQVAPDVEVFHEVVSGGTGPYNEKLLTMWTGGSPPDVWGFGMNYIAFWARGMMADLNPLITRAKPGYDALMLDVYNSWKGKTPS